MQDDSTDGFTMEEVEEHAAVAEEVSALMWALAEHKSIDPLDVAYALWVNLLHTLFYAGYTSEEATRDVVDHEKIHQQHEAEHKLDEEAQQSGIN